MDRKALTQRLHELNIEIKPYLATKPLDTTTPEPIDGAKLKALYDEKNRIIEQLAALK